MGFLESVKLNYIFSHFILIFSCHIATAALLYLFWLSFDSALNQFVLINQQALLSARLVFCQFKK